MTMNLITGKAGAPHITSSDQGAMQAGLVGNGNYLLQGGDGKFPAVTMQSANKALVPVLNLVIEGRYARVTAAETVTIESGVTGRNRNDLICVKYTRDSNNIETIALAVLKGTATSGTAADPTVPSGSILNNSGTVWIPIARIPISGITAGTPVMLVKQLPPMSQLWDSVTLYSAKGFTIIRTGMMMLIKYAGSFAGDSWSSVQCDYTLPVELRPPIEVNGMVCVSNGQTSRMLVVNPNGTIRCANMGAAGSNQGCVGSLCYPIP